MKKTIVPVCLIVALTLLFAFFFSLRTPAAYAAQAKPAAAHRQAVSAPAETAPAATQADSAQDVSFFGLYNNSGAIWSHEVKKTVLVVCLWLIMVAFMGAKFLIDTGKNKH